MHAKWMLIDCIGGVYELFFGSGLIKSISTFNMNQSQYMGEYEARYSGLISNMSNDYVQANKRASMRSLTCPLCKNLYREATTICFCLHSFCKPCIYQKLEEDEIYCCPVCKAHLGSFPYLLLRPDHNLQELVMQVLAEYSTIRDERFITSKINCTYNTTKANVLSQEVPYYIPTTSEKENEANSRMRKKMEDQTRKTISGRIIDEEKIEDTSDIKDLSNLSSNPIWFCLHACDNKGRNALPQIPKPYIRTKHGDLAVCFISKYIAQKLNLKHESEVEVMCCGQPLIPNLSLRSLVEMWIGAIAITGPADLNSGEERANGENLIMELTYRRRKKHRTIPS